MLAPLLPSSFSARRLPARVVPSLKWAASEFRSKTGESQPLCERELGLRDIAVDVRQGVVFLSGEVRTLEEAQHAATVVRGVPGVRDLTSSLSVKP